VYFEAHERTPALHGHVQVDACAVREREVEPGYDLVRGLREDLGGLHHLVGLGALPAVACHPDINVQVVPFDVPASLARVEEVEPDDPLLGGPDSEDVVVAGDRAPRGVQVIYEGRWFWRRSRRRSSAPSKH